MTRRGLLALLPATTLPAEDPGLAPPPDAALPLGLAVRDASGRSLGMAEALGGLPAVFAFADRSFRVPGCWATEERLAGLKDL